MAKIARGTAREKPLASGAALYTQHPDYQSQAHSPAAQAVAEVAGYIAQLTAELSHLAGSAKLESLAYLLSMARLEAEMLARRKDPPGH